MLHTAGANLGSLSPNVHSSLLMVYKVGTPKGPLGSCSPEEAAESSDCFPRHESCSQGPSSGAWVLTETIRVGPREPQGLRSVGVHISEEGQAKSCQSPRGRSAHASWAPHPEAVRPGPFRQLAGHQSQKELISGTTVPGTCPGLPGHEFGTATLLGDLIHLSLLRAG